MKVRVNVEYVSSVPDLPERALVAQWARAALKGYERDVEVGVRVVDEPEIAELNQRFRNKTEPTDVLSFPFEDPPGIRTDLLGDVVVCAPVVCHQAQVQGKPAAAHWAHVVVHGIMHLRGYDHETPQGAHAMEGMEVRVLQRLGFTDPYASR